MALRFGTPDREKREERRETRERERETRDFLLLFKFLAEREREREGGEA